MPLPVTKTQLSNALDNLMGMAADVRLATTTIKNDSIAAPVPRKRLVHYMARLDRAVDLIDAHSSTPGLIGYARGQYDDASLDIVAEFVTFRSACVQLQNWVFDAFPKDATSGAWLVSAYANDGTETVLDFTTIQLATFVGHCDTLLATMS